MLPGHPPGFGGASSRLVFAPQGPRSPFLSSRPEPRPASPCPAWGGCGGNPCRAGSRRFPPVPGDGDVCREMGMNAGRWGCIPGAARDALDPRTAPGAAAFRLFLPLPALLGFGFPSTSWRGCVKLINALSRAGGEGFMLPTSPFWVVLGLGGWEEQHVSPPCAIPGVPRQPQPLSPGGQLSHAHCHLSLHFVHFPALKKIQTCPLLL